MDGLAEMRRNYADEPERRESFGLPCEETSDNNDRSVQELIKGFCNTVRDVEKEEKSVGEDEICTNPNMKCDTVGLRPKGTKGKSRDENLTYPEHMSGLECNSLKPKD